MIEIYTDTTRTIKSSGEDVFTISNGPGDGMDVSIRIHDLPSSMGFKDTNLCISRDVAKELGDALIAAALESE